MKFNYLLLFCFGNFVISEKITKNIRNIELPSCKSCIHYKPNIYNNDFTSSISKCDKFGDKDIITGEITFDYADLCRRDETKCGKEGKYFKKEPNLQLKIFIHNFISNFSYLIIIISIVLSSLTAAK